MVDTHPPKQHAAEDSAVLRTPRPHRNQGALQRALRQERVARRRNFFSWLLTVLVAAGAGVSIIVWIADRDIGPARAPGGAATPASIPAPSDDVSEPVPAGAMHGLPAR